jgi:hypothetical protein
VGHFRLALVLGLAGAAATACVFPYLYATMPGVVAKLHSTPIPYQAIVALQLVQAFATFSLLGWIGLLVGAQIGLDAPWLRAWVYRTGPVAIDRRRLARSAMVGIAAGAVILVIDAGLKPLMPAALNPHPEEVARWKGFLASFYGGIGEEIQLRLFLMTLLAWGAWKVFARNRPLPPPGAFWFAVVAAALVFAAGHLPAAAQVWPLDGVVILRTMLLNAIAGLPFGWLFWRYGFECAVVAHFNADLVLHVLFAA